MWKNNNWEWGFLLTQATDHSPTKDVAIRERSNLTHSAQMRGKLLQPTDGLGWRIAGQKRPGGQATRKPRPNIDAHFVSEAS